MFRRFILIFFALAWSWDAGAATTDYRGYRIDTSGIAGSRRLAAIVEAVKCQVDIVESVPFPDDIRRHMRSIPIEVMPESFNGRWRDGRLKLGGKQFSDRTPVLLHEYVHALHERYLTAEQSKQVQRLHKRARALGAFRSDAYMLSTPGEFLAMAATTVMVGRIAREPFDRRRLARAMPEVTPFILATFRLPANILDRDRTRACG